MAAPVTPVDANGRYPATIATTSVVNDAGLVTVTTQITRPADTTAYAANDAIANSTSSPTSGGFTLSGIARASAKSGIISDIIVASTNPAGGLSGELWIFDTAVTAINDNAAFGVSNSEIATLVARVPFTTVAGTNNSAVQVSNLAIGYNTVGSANLRFLIRSAATYTPISGEVFTIRVKALQTS